VFINKYDDESYQAYTFPARMDKAIHTLEGILRGISIDSEITREELNELRAWCKDNEFSVDKEPFKTLIPYIIEALEDDYLDEHEREDIITICQSIDSGSKYYKVVTSDLQRLQGIFHGIMADSKITDDEIKHLRAWTDENRHLIGMYPYDELHTLLLNILEDGVVDNDERRMLEQFFHIFIKRGESTTIEDTTDTKVALRMDCLVTSDPNIAFMDSMFCITGKFKSAKRSEVVEQIQVLGGQFKSTVSQKTQYLIVGGAGNSAWTYNCYGRKIEDATNLRREGYPIQIVSEADFWDAVENHIG